MASAYYKMPEVMDKLGKSEKDVQNLIKQGKLRQYMDAGKPVFKVDEVDTLAEQIVGLDLTQGGSDLGLALEETGEITLEPDEDKPKSKESEGGFGLSQMGDLTSADTNVGTVGINILSGTDDAYKLTEDTKAETQIGDIDEIESLDVDSNLESFGSGSGLLDLSLQADDTSLGAVLDDILPSGAEAGEVGGADLPSEDLKMVDEDEGLGGAERSSRAAVAGGAAMSVGAGVPAGTGVQMVQIVPAEDPASTLYGLMMFLPVAALAIVAIIVTAAIQDVSPSLMKVLTDKKLADISMIWVVSGGLALLVLILWAMTAMGGEKKAKPAKAVREKKPKKKKK